MEIRRFLAPGGFGCLEAPADIAFEPGKMNLILGDNEAGKSTLLQGLLCGLYDFWNMPAGIIKRFGLPKVQAELVKRFKPWNANALLPVELEVTAQGMDYRIQRDLESRATVVYNLTTGVNETERFKKGNRKWGVGEALLGMNDIVFLNSACVTQNNLQAFENAGESAALVTEIQRAVDVSALEDTSTKGALQRLEEARKKGFITGKARHKNRIDELLEEKTTLTRQIAALDDLHHSAMATLAGIQHQAEAIAHLEAEVRQTEGLCLLAEYQELQGFFQTEATRQQEIQRRQEALRVLESTMTEGFPAALRSLSPTPHWREALQRLQVKLGEERRLAEAIAAESQRLEAQGFDAQRFAALAPRFQPLSLEAMTFLQEYPVKRDALIQARQALQAENDALTQAQQRQQAQRATARRMGGVLLGLGVLVALIGGMWMALPLGWALGIGLILWGLGQGYAGFRPVPPTEGLKAEACEAALRQNQTALDALAEQCTAYRQRVSGYGEASEVQLAADLKWFYTAKNETVVSLERLEALREHQRGEIARQCREIQELGLPINVAHQAAPEALEAWVQTCLDYVTSCEEQRQAENALAELTHHVAPGDVVEARSQRLHVLEKRLAALPSDIPPPTEPQQTYTTRLEALHRDLAQRRRAYQEAEASAADTRDQVYKQRPPLQDRLADVTEALERLTAFRDALAEAQAALETLAAESHREWSAVLNQGTNRILQGFNPRYGQIRFGADLSFTLEDTEHRKFLDMAEALQALSAGAKDQLYLAIRLAIAEFISAQGREGVPLILDDPFVNLDDSRFQRAMDFLLSQSADSTPQMIVFSCHAQRHQRWIDTLTPEARQSLRVMSLQPRRAAALVG